MIRLGTLAWMIVITLLGVGLFQLKYEVQAREKELHQIRKQIEAQHDATRVLEAEWSYLNDLERLSDLARRHSDLVPTMPTQIGTLANLPDYKPTPPEAESQSPLIVSETPANPVPAPLPTNDDLISAILNDMRSETAAANPPATAPQEEGAPQ